MTAMSLANFASVSTNSWIVLRRRSARLASTSASTASCVRCSRSAEVRRRASLPALEGAAVADNGLSDACRPP